ncbi:Translation initiation factor IF-2 [bacterium HR19]|nr:Translation initiation factor IF-2 [bacterium HR19]
MSEKEQKIIIVKKRPKEEPVQAPQESIPTTPETQKKSEEGKAPARDFKKHEPKKEKKFHHERKETKFEAKKKFKPHREIHSPEAKTLKTLGEEKETQKKEKTKELERKAEEIKIEKIQRAEDREEEQKAEEQKEEITEKKEEEKEELKEEIEIFEGGEFIIPFRPRKPFFKKKKRFDKQERIVQPQQPSLPQKIKIPEEIRIADLSKITGIKASEIIKKLLELGREANINSFITKEEAELICADFGIEVEIEEFDESAFIDTSPDPEDKLKPRPPVVVMMGHVDHGKTTLLDAIRQTNVAEKEVGGITQSIGAYTVEIQRKDTGEKGIITFIDTPGHEAFTEMRARGAKVADIAVLVVAADEGVKPQTEEAISHAKAAGVPIVVAINKIDKPGANPNLVKNQLAQIGLIPDEWGGDTLFAEISAKRKIGIEDLLEKILIQADLLNLRANPDRPAEGVIIESSIDKGFGYVATVIIQRGTLRKGDIFVAGLAWGKIRNIFSDRGKALKEVGPGFPAKIVIGGEELPLAGDKLYVVKDEQIASKIVEERKKRQKKRTSISLEEIYQKLSERSEKVVLPLILKANSKGALDALEKEINEIQIPQLEIRIIHKGIGVISQSDINLASASNGIVIGYSVGIEKQAQNLAKMHGVQVRLYKIIYEIVDDIKKAAQGLLKPKEKEVIVGRAKVLKIFKLSVGKVLGCIVESGKLSLGLSARVKRNGNIICEGKISSLKRFKDSVQEVKEGEECGVLLEGLTDAKEEDIIECYEIIKEEIKIL